MVSLTSIIHTHTRTIHELNELKERESLFLLTAITAKESEALSGELHWNKGTVRFQKQVLSNTTTINLTTQTSQGEKGMTFRYTNTTGTLLQWKGSE
ncbi:hypothetical protein Q73_09250 [Bacillus coahuilensis m2-6]|uniref:competence type IV pilus minor pilin ComGG n=1 Tax=Bacillus coahuilensis TaxID=408580 RepID=UPI0001850745|nr:competence type IV pilus minor pilin ComGG [Bacillus coahuilensis]KUP07392.1 hypothetical protein Q73_09250 [Bacillus coahuilensis m2-6]